MAKREFISREEALLHPFANGKYDHKNADINFILGHESYKEWLETFPVFTEQEIIKPYLEKLRAKIYEEIDFEEKWLNDVFWKDKGITLRDIEIAMNGIRHVVKGELEE